MPRKHKHHRRHRAQTTTTQSTENVSTQSTTAAAVNYNISIVKQDLLRTAILTTIIIVGLFAMSGLNTKQAWTLQLGSQLYSLLHIR